MNRYINQSGKVIEGTEKAYNLIYKGQGYITEEEYNKKQEESKKKSISKMNKEELQKLALEIEVATEGEIKEMNVDQLKAAIKAANEEKKEEEE